MSPEQLYAEWEPRALSIARGFRRSLPPQILSDDLDAAARMGLWHAVTRNPSHEAFEGYMRLVVQGAIKDELRRQDWQSRRARAQGRAFEVLRLDAFERSDHNRHRQALSVEPDAERHLEAAEKAAQIATRLSRLRPRDRLVMANLLEGKKAVDIARDFGVTEARIGQIKARSLRQLQSERPRKTKRAVAAVACPVVPEGDWTRLEKLSERSKRIFLQWLLIGTAKHVAYDFKISRSRMSDAIRAGLDALGLSCMPLNAPLVLSVRARAEAEGVAMRPFPHPLRALAFLPDAVRQVARLLVEGHAPNQIAMLRGRAPRTIANQLAWLFKRFGVRGASEFKAELARRIVAEWS